MADIRIKDLTTEAPNSLTGDFLPIDGGTGTRKLSAYSPTFGGNATVGGTLTVSGLATATSGVQINGGSFAAGKIYHDAAAGLVVAGKTGSTNDFLLTDPTGAFTVLANLTGTANLITGGTFKVNATTASNTTSSGALVVTGGVGVGGSISLAADQNTFFSGSWPRANFTTNGASTWLSGATTGAVTIQHDFQNRSTTSLFRIYGTGDAQVTGSLLANGVTSANTSQPNDTSVNYFTVIGGDDGILGGLLLSLGVRPSATGANRYGYISVGDNGAMRPLSLNDNGAGAYGQVLVRSSTASTTTSSGALVVSGGVGVAGAIYAGGDLTVDKTEPTITFKRAANTNLNIVNFWTGVAADFGIGLRNTTDSDLHIYNYGTANDALKIAKADSLATFGGAVRTAAPSGGTAANWKLGTVATVSPTSPNRTIEVDIGGTIYYIHAKTTNN
jgi:hypothetical protein